MLSGARLVEVEGSLSRRRDFDITAWVAAALPAAAARLRYVRNLWISEPQFRKMESPSLAPGHKRTHTNKYNGNRRHGGGPCFCWGVDEPVVFGAQEFTHFVFL